MWQRFAVTLYLVAATAGLPFAGALAQATGTGAEPKVRAEIEAVFTGWLEALNKADGKAAAAFFAPGAPAINLAGLVRGDSQDYVNRVEQQRQRNVKTVATIAQVELIGSDAAYALGPYTATLGPDNRRQQLEGNWLQLFERRGGTWKIGASSFTQVGPPKNVAK